MILIVFIIFVEVNHTWMSTIARLCLKIKIFNEMYYFDKAIKDGFRVKFNVRIPA